MVLCPVESPAPARGLRHERTRTQVELPYKGNSPPHTHIATVLPSLGLCLDVRGYCSRRFHVQSFGHVFQVLIKLYDQNVTTTPDSILVLTTDFSGWRPPLAGSGFPASADRHGAVAGQSWCARPGSPPAPTRAPGGDCARPLLHCLRLRHCLRQVGRQNLKRAAAPPHVSACGHSRWYARPSPLAVDEQNDPPMMATHWSADDPTHLGGYQSSPTS